MAGVGCSRSQSASKLAGSRSGCPAAASPALRASNAARARNLACRSLAACALTKAVPKGICTTPPFAAKASAISSLMLRSKPGVKWRNAEWLAITGTRLSSMACMAAASETWETSTMMPSRFICAISSRPNGLSPFHLRSRP